MPTPKRDTVLIDGQAQLDEFFQTIVGAESAGPIACDTEFVRTNTYWPMLCLVQLSVGSRIACLDVLAVSDLAPLSNAMSSGNEPWILHAAKQDLEALHSTFRQIPTQVIDTQISAGLLGHPPQIGYANLVEALVGVRLAKAETRTDWSRRPLTAAQLAYAADDVDHLPTINTLLTERLQAAGRRDWADEDCAALLKTEQYESRPAQAWRRLASIPYLPVPVQSRARQLAAWREDQATKHNRPRKWILADKPLLQIAHANPTVTTALSKIEELPPAVIRKSGDALIAVCKNADEDVAKGNVDFVQEAKPTPPDEKALKRLAGIVRVAAEELDLAPELLATRKELSRLLRGYDDIRPLQGWRKDTIGASLLAAL